MNVRPATIERRKRLLVWSCGGGPTLFQTVPRTNKRTARSNLPIISHRSLDAVLPDSTECSESVISCKAYHRRQKLGHKVFGSWPARAINSSSEDRVENKRARSCELFAR